MLQPSAATVKPKDLVKVRLFIDIPLSTDYRDVINNLRNLWILNSRRLSILTPDFSQRIADLANRRISLDTFKYSRQEVFIGRRRLLECVECRSRGLCITSLTQCS